MNKIGKIWTNRKLILEGLANTIFKKEFVEDVSELRMEICNDCSYKGNDCLVPGTGPCCSACGCSLKMKTRSLASSCGLTEIGKMPKWLPVISLRDQEKHFSDLKDEDDA